MAAEVSLRSKTLYRIELLLIKYIPILVAIITISNMILSYFDIDIPLFSYIGSSSLFSLMFMFVSSIVFRFCIWHRLIIIYLAVIWLLNIIDLYIGIHMSDLLLLITYLGVAGLFLLLIVYSKLK